jgi:phthalate 4,5-dioxygenase oxygenase subunit
VTESMGAISDRTLEHLAPSDRMITMTRRRLLEAARALRDNGTVPPLVDHPEISSVARSGDLIAPVGSGVARRLRANAWPGDASKACRSR